MTKSIMKWDKIQNIHAINFEVSLSGDGILDQLGFIYLLSCRNNGDIIADGIKFTRGDNKKFGSIKVKFTNYTEWDLAVQHCWGNLDVDGAVKADYVGALSRADPGKRQTKILFKKVTGREAY